MIVPVRHSCTAVWKRVAISLVVGLVVTCGIAWGAAATTTGPSNEEPWMATHVAGDSGRLWDEFAGASWPEVIGVGWRTEREWVTFVSQHATAGGPVNETYGVSEISYGWPLRAFRGFWIDEPGRAEHRVAIFGHDQVWLPCRPMPVGLLLDTLFVAASLLVIWELVRLCRRRKRAWPARLGRYAACAGGGFAVALLACAALALSTRVDVADRSTGDFRYLDSWHRGGHARDWGWCNQSLWFVGSGPLVSSVDVFDAFRNNLPTDDLPISALRVGETLGPWSTVGIPIDEQAVHSRVIDFRVGWPCRMARAVHERSTRDPRKAIRRDLWHGGLVIEARSTLDGACVIPVRPIWAGLITNWMFYSLALLGLTVVWGGVVRHVRRSRGQCVACGYIVAPGERCPECGGRSVVPDAD